MDLLENKPPVLARFPKIVSSEHRHVQKELLPSRGRLLGQAISFKLLGIAALVLVGLAVVPFALRSTSPPVPAAASTLAPAWQPSPPAPSPEVAPVRVAPVAAIPTSTPAPASPSPMPEAYPRPTSASAPQEAPAAALMSAWPNPAHPASAAEIGRDEPQVGANQAMAIRPSEYRRNSYDNSRSSIR